MKAIAKWYAIKAIGEDDSTFFIRTGDGGYLISPSAEMAEDICEDQCKAGFNAYVAEFDQEIIIEETS